MIRVSHPTKKVHTNISVPGSKSESNRALILRVLSGNRFEIENLSPARDTQQLKNLLSSSEKLVDVLDAGTSMRFLTALYSIKNEHKMITGSERMKERPIASLVRALNHLGFDVRYSEKQGFPPVEIVPIENLESKIGSEVAIEGNISSQFITALLLIAPFLPNGLTIRFTTPLGSKPYIEMTAKMLDYFGITCKWDCDSIMIPHSELLIRNYSVGGDWSSASYWYSIAFLAEEAEILLEGLKDDWTQGDRVIADWMKRFGVQTEFTTDGALLKKTNANYPRMMKMNFSDNPDLAQTFAVMFAAKNIYATFSGIDSLKIKETDRIAALHKELQKLNVAFEYAAMYDFYQLKGNFQIPSSPFATYGDHRMAMSFTPLALLGEVEIENEEVVEKSYPAFWSDLERAGFVTCR